MNIALALSGGGVRATSFHLGVLARLAEEQRLEDVTLLSTVSGGSLCVGLVYALAGAQWPTSAAYLGQVVPAARRTLTSADLQRSLIRGALRAPWRLSQGRASLLSALLQSEWGITARLCDLPAQPRWMINATCYETGKNWRFERARMGDYLFGYSNDTDLPLSDALAASSGFPGGIGALALPTTGRAWFRYAQPPVEEGPVDGPSPTSAAQREPMTPAFPEVHLWDGGVYDNHGLEGIHDFQHGWRKEVGFLLVSDGAGRPHPEPYRRGVSALLRLMTGIMMDQVRSLRSRAILERIVNHGDLGAFLQLGNTCESVLRAAGRTEEAARYAPTCLPEEEAELAANLPTSIGRMRAETFERLFRHGFEVADYTLHGYHPDRFAYLGYRAKRGGQDG